MHPLLPGLDEKVVNVITACTAFGENCLTCKHTLGVTFYRCRHIGDCPVATLKKPVIHMMLDAFRDYKDKL